MNMKTLDLLDKMEFSKFIEQQVLHQQKHTQYFSIQTVSVKVFSGENVTQLQKDN